jgi:hypothetical protein
MQSHLERDYSDLRRELDSEYPDGYNFGAKDVDRRRRARGALWWTRKHLLELLYDSLGENVKAELPLFLDPKRTKDPEPTKLYDYLKVKYGPRGHFASVAEIFREVWRTNIKEGEDPTEKLVQIDRKLWQVICGARYMDLNDFFRSITFHALASSLPPSYRDIVREELESPTTTDRGSMDVIIREYKRRKNSDHLANGATQPGRNGEAKGGAEGNAGLSDTKDSRLDEMDGVWCRYHRSRTHESVYCRRRKRQTGYQV